LSATQRKVTKEKSPLWKCFDKTTQSPLWVYKLASFSLLKQCKPLYPTRLACFIANHFPMRYCHNLRIIVKAFFSTKNQKGLYYLNAYFNKFIMISTL